MRHINILFIFLFSISLFSSISSAKITGEVITGNVPYDSTGINVVIQGLPSVYLLYPENKTYIKSNLTLNYTSYGSPDNVTYSLDNAANVTLSGTTSIVFSEGQRRLMLFANNAYGSTNSNTFFTINTSLLQILYSNYNGSTKGSSTDFLSKAYEDLIYLNSTTLEDTRYGKIVYSSPINLENDSNISDGVVDIDSNIKILDSSISVNSALLPNFDKPARLYFYFLPYTNPRVLVDGVVCSNTLCSNRTYSDGNLSFNVIGFSNYSIEEALTPVPAPSGGGGGGGGGGPSTYHSIDIISPGSVEIGKNDDLVVPITIRNPENIVMKGIKLFANSTKEGLSAIFEDITIDELQPGENRTVMLFLKSHDLSPGSYEIELQADVSDPKFKDSEKLYIRAVEIVGKVEVIERLLLAQELFRENPECLELNDLLVKAKSLADEGNVDEARAMVQEAISRCRDLVTNKEFPTTVFSKTSSWRTPLEIVLILIVIASIVSQILRKPTINLTRKAPKKRRSLLKRMFNRG